MSNSLSVLHNHLTQLSDAILDLLSTVNYTPREGSNVSTKSMLESLLSSQNFKPNPEITETQFHNSIKDFALACALLSSSQTSTHELLLWIPNELSVMATEGFKEFSRMYFGSVFGSRNEKRVCELLGLDCGLLSEEKRLVVVLMPEVLPELKGSIKESCIDKGTDGDEVSAASARAPVGFAIVAACQYRWFVSQVDYPHLGKVSNLVIPCGLTALDHWSPEVKNIASADEIWYQVVEMSVLLVTCIQQSNPRSPWFERMLNEMLSHLERQPRNKDRRVAWLTFIEPLLHSVGLVLLAHFRRIFPLFFQWMHADDDETVLLVLKRVQTIIRLTWIRSTPYVERLVDELVVLYKEAALKKAREEIRKHVLEILVLLHHCKGLQFEATWEKHRDDPNLTTLSSSLREIYCE